MSTRVIKRDGRTVGYERDKITQAIRRAIASAQAAGVTVDNPVELAEGIAADVEQTLQALYAGSGTYPSVENIQDLVVAKLKRLAPEVARLYAQYREQRTRARIKSMAVIRQIRDIARETTRDNANVGNNLSAKWLQMASTISALTNQLDMPEDIARAHLNGVIHIHDLDAYNLSVNCLQIDTGRMLREGFNTGYGTINPPKRIDTAAALSCIILQSTQNDMFGGQSHYDFDNDMADFVRLTEAAIRQEVTEVMAPDTPAERVDEIVERRLQRAVHQAMQSVVYNLNSMHSRAGSQVPFSTVNIGIPRDRYAALVCQALLEEYAKGLGKGEQPIFPNICFRLKQGVNTQPGDPYYYLKQLACQVAAQRLNPTFINCDSSSDLPLYEEGFLPARMGCRTNIGNNVNGRKGPKDRGNIAPVSINLPRIAIQARRASQSADEAWSIFLQRLDAVLEICERQLLHRYQTLRRLRISDLPFVAGQGIIMGSAGKSPDDSIEDILKNGTFSIGFIGLAEALTCLFGVHHGQDETARLRGMEIVQRIRAFCDQCTAQHQLNFTCYATPAEGLSGRFVAIDRQEFGTTPGVTDKDYYTNSFHVPVSFNISAVRKFQVEAPFHALCNAGHITYIEFDRPPVDDPGVIERLVDYAIANTDIGYFGFNFEEVYCRDCAQDHIQGNLCPRCGSGNLQQVDRVTGYLSLKERFSPGKAAELKERTAHIQAASPAAGGDADGASRRHRP
ncbi:MAG: anaerobic ribonucleoside-triphosphate reductase [Bacillota bacterium]|jgi:anaerobic ribonucleoside-triphosphate reductase